MANPKKARKVHSKGERIQIIHDGVLVLEVLVGTGKGSAVAVVIRDGEKRTYDIDNYYAREALRELEEV